MLGGHVLGRYVDVRFNGNLARLVFAQGASPAEVPDAVFDVDQLRRALRPDRVDRKGN